jgi:hypothetical protein
LDFLSKLKDYAAIRGIAETGMKSAATLSYQPEWMLQKKAEHALITIEA